MKIGFAKYINSRRDIALSPSQQEAVNKISKFLNSDSHQCFIFKGCAGSGKTFISALIREYKTHQTHIYTPTGRAAKVIKSMINPKASKENISTIHHGIYTHATKSTMYLQGSKEIPENILSTKDYFELRENESSKETIYICDEASMISDFKTYSSFLEYGSGYLLSDLFEYIGKRKIIFVGDNGQLTPIKMNHSPAINSAYIEEKFKVKTMETELVEVIRQKTDSGILKNSTIVREKIHKKEYNNVGLSDSFVDVIEESQENAVKICAKNYNPSSFGSSVMITHTRQLCQIYNNQIRALVHPKASSKNKTFTVGDRLLCSRNNYYHEVLNGELLTVKELFDGDEDKIWKLLKLLPTDSEKQLYGDRIKNDGRIHVELKYRKAKLEYHDVFGNISIINCFLLENPIHSDELMLSPIETRAHYVEFRMRFDKSVKKYKKIENKKILTKKEIQWAINNGKIINPETDSLLQALICKYGYALTLHKAQGGEWNKTIVDFNTKHFNTQNEEYFRWIYTAITRAKEELYIINNMKNSLYEKI